MNGGEQMLSDGRFGERQQLSFIEAALRALRFRIKFADGLNFVAEELDADGAVGFRGIDIENAAAARELTGHFDEVHLGVADAGEMSGEDFDVDFFAAFQRDREAGVIVAIEEPERRRFNRAIRIDTAPVANFHRAVARCSCTSGCGERFSKGRTSCAGSRTTWAGFTAPVSSQPARSIGSSSSAALLSQRER